MKIYNLRTDIQKQQYSLTKDNKFISRFVRKFVLKDFERKNKEKFERFEKFINNNLQITKEFKSLEELNNANLKYDYLLSGSDQLWNLRANDFDWAYFLEFANSGKKISYAASFGPKKMVWTEEEKNRVRKDLEQYKYISVREEGSQNNIRELLGKEVPIYMDPTILLTKDEWNKIVPKERIYKGKYILYYSLGQKKGRYRISK